MLLFIWSSALRQQTARRFKYISCYCLSQKPRDSVQILALFKYISCYCLSIYTNFNAVLNTHSNTSHVIVYPLPAADKLRDRIFKYISCYCLSHGRLAAALLEGNSNTSHVIVYPCCRCLWKSSTRIQIHLMLLFILSSGSMVISGGLFKYISCYCLSPCGVGRFYLNVIQIHLMLLFISWPRCCCSAFWDSNTSHVIVYLCTLEGCQMLILFKYISCYCLS